MSEVESLDFFRDGQLVNDPYLYLAGAAPPVPRARRVAPRCRHGDGLRRGADGARRLGDVFVVHVGDWALPRITRPTRGRRRQRADRSAP